nr:EOG090X05AE [Lepidurus arcticus]
MGILEKISDIEKEIAKTQKNKATEYHLGLLKAKLAKYRSQLLEPSKKAGEKGEGFDVLKSGDARVALIGFPSVGKSTLLSTLTKTQSEAASYEFTTLTCIPGVIEYKGANIQLLDLPGIIEGASQGKGRGKQVIAVARTADMVIMMCDATKGELQKTLLEKELESVGIRLNTSKPNIYYKQKKGGGIAFNSTVTLTKVDEKLVQLILHEYKIFNAEVLFREDCGADELIDVISDNRVYMSCLYVYNKVDQISMEEVDRLARQPFSCVVSCNLKLNLDYMLEVLWDYLSLIRVYTKKPGEAPNFEEGLILRRGVTVEHVCHSVHRTLAAVFKYALVWIKLRVIYFLSQTCSLLCRYVTQSAKAIARVLESLVKNCGSPIHDEIGTKQFMEDFRELVRSANNDAVRSKVLELIQTWAHAFRNSPKYRPVLDTFNIMKAEGYAFPPLNTTSDAMFAADVAPEWADGDACHRCRTAFGVMVRKHHCRACGQVFCGKCSSESCTLPRFGIEKEVRVCDACYDQHIGYQEGGKPVKEESLEAFAAKVVQAQSSPSRSPAPQQRKTAEELQEEEELQLALALSQSEAEEQRKKGPVSLLSPRKEVSPTPVTAPEAVDPELARYLNRSYWESRESEREREKPSAPQAQQVPQPAPIATTPVMSPTTPTKLTEQFQNGEMDPLNDFVQRLRGQVEMFLNRLRSNSSRGRWVANDSSVQSLFLSLTQAHPSLLQHIAALDDQRMNLEHLQDKLTQARDNRAALDALREEHHDRRRREQEEAERTRQMQMAHKLEIMRLKKQEYLQYQRELAMQRIKEQERERQMRLDQQKAQYLRGGYPAHPQPPPQNMQYNMPGPYMEAGQGFPAPHPQAQHPQAQHPHAQHPQVQHPHVQHPQAQHPHAQHPQAPPPEQMPAMAYASQPHPHYNMYMQGPVQNMPGMGYPTQHPGPVPSGPPPQQQQHQPQQQMPAPAPVENVQPPPAAQPTIAELISFD